jgi:hypothetical protein
LPRDNNNASPIPLYKGGASVLNGDNEDGNEEASPIPSCKGGAGAAPWGAREASPIPPCKGGADAVPWGAREASPIPSCKGGAGGAPWGTREASAIPFCEGGAGAVPASGIIFLLIYCDDVDKNTGKNVLFSKRGERCKLNKKGDRHRMLK